MRAKIQTESELSAHIDARRSMSARDDGAAGAGAGDGALSARALHPPFESFAYTATERAVVDMSARSKSQKIMTTTTTGR